jgi:hypothetical protein
MTFEEIVSDYSDWLELRMVELDYPEVLKKELRTSMLIWVSTSMRYLLKGR